MERITEGKATTTMYYKHVCNRRIGESNLYREMKRKTDNTETREIVANQWFVLKTADLTELNRVKKSFFRLLILLFSMLLFSFDGSSFFAQSNKSNWFPGSGLYFQQFSGGGFKVILNTLPLVMSHNQILVCAGVRETLVFLLPKAVLTKKRWNF